MDFDAESNALLSGFAATFDNAPTNERTAAAVHETTTTSETVASGGSALFSDAAAAVFFGSSSPLPLVGRNGLEEASPSAGPVHARPGVVAVGEGGGGDSSGDGGGEGGLCHLQHQATSARKGRPSVHNRADKKDELISNALGELMSGKVTASHHATVVFRASKIQRYGL